ncbi:UNVERIFIED_CONTAM: hypothetical protein FKN15_078237 [Acipenser sinensis]
MDGKRDRSPSILFYATAAWCLHAFRKTPLYNRMFGAAQNHGGVSLHFLVTELPKPIFEEAACRASDEAFEALGLATLRDDYDNGRPIRAKAYWYKRILPHPCGPHVNWLTVLLALGPHTPTTAAVVKHTTGVMTHLENFSNKTSLCKQQRV